MSRSAPFVSAAPRSCAKRVTVRFRSAEPLASLPTATLRQAGLALAAMKVVKLADGSFSATATIAAGTPGPATIVLAGRDTGRYSNSSALRVTVK